MYKFLLVIIISSVFLSGCALVPQNKLDEKTPEKFALTEKAQDSVFRIVNGWTGSMGSFPILDQGGERPRQFNDLPIFLDDRDAEQLLSGRMPGCVVGSPLIKISANITLVKMTGVNYSIPPDDDGRQPQESYYSAKVNKLNDIFIQAEKCED